MYEMWMLQDSVPNNLNLFVLYNQLVKYLKQIKQQINCLVDLFYLREQIYDKTKQLVYNKGVEFYIFVCDMNVFMTFTHIKVTNFKEEIIGVNKTSN